MTAAPLALLASGKKGVSVATVTLRANLLPYCECQDSCALACGSGPVPSSMALLLIGRCDGRHYIVGLRYSLCCEQTSSQQQALPEQAKVRGVAIDKISIHLVPFPCCVFMNKQMVRAI